MAGKKPKQVRKDAKLQNLVLRDPQAHEDLWRFRHPEEGGTVLGFDEILVEIPLRYGFNVSLSTLSTFYAWFELKVRMDAKADAADQLMEELAKSGKFSTEQIKEAGQRLFMTEGIVKQQPKVFFAAVEMQQSDTKLQQNERVISQRDQTIKQKDKLIAQGERRVKLLEEAAAEAKAKILALTTAAKSTGGLTPETLKQIEEAAGLL